MADPANAGIWSDPALYISLAAFGLSAFQAVRSIRQDARTKRRIEFIEYIAGKFSSVDVTLDALETKLRRAIIDPAISSHDILDVAVPAVRASNRALTEVSNMPAVSKDLLASSGVDELDNVLTMVEDGSFEGVTRNLGINTALKIVTRVATKCSATQREVQSIHLK